MGMTSNGLSFWQAETQGIELLETAIGDFLDQRAQELPHQEAIVYSGYPELGAALTLRWTYAEYRDRANAVAKGLLALGLKPGEHIAVWAANLPEWPLLQMATAKAGLVLVTINPVLHAEEVEYILQQGDVRALLFMANVRDHDCLATIRALTTPGACNGEVASERLPVLRFVSLIGRPPADLLEQVGWRPALLQELVEAGAAISDAALAERQATVRPSDPALLLYTSGTTGFPKGALITHRSALNNALSQMRRLGLNETDRACAPMPFFHAMGCVLGVLGALAAGATLHPMIAFDPLKSMQIISRERCTGLAAVPTMLFAILQHPQFGDYDLSSLRVVGSGGAPVPVALMEQVKARIGADVTIGFGQTEASCAITLTPPADSFELKATTVGIPLPHVAVKIVDSTSGTIGPMWSARRTVPARLPGDAGLL